MKLKYDWVDRGHQIITLTLALDNPEFVEDFLPQNTKQMTQFTYPT